MPNNNLLIVDSETQPLFNNLVFNENQKIIHIKLYNDIFDKVIPAIDREVKLVVINDNALPDSNYKALEIIAHIRCHDFGGENSNSNNVHILVLTRHIKTLQDYCAYFSESSNDYAIVLLSREVHIKYFTHGDFQGIIETVKRLLERDLCPNLKDEFCKTIPLKESIDRHSIANQWGAYCLAKIAGVLLPTLPTDLYFKYLVAKYQSQISLSASNKTITAHKRAIKVLLIDDEAEKGWKTVLKEIIEKKVKCNNTNISCDITAIISREFVTDNIIDQEWDIIFLDLRMPDEGAGKELLKKIKEKRPDHQVIIFTASNKAWNHKVLYDLGADAYYIKEHPEQIDEQKIKDNYENLLVTIETCLKNGEQLKWYWQHIRKILNNTSIEYLPIPNNPNGSKIDERLKERLCMFYGLLKRAHQQTDFDKNTFYYSDLELAFMTLWSCLNDIQENYYVKTGVGGTLKWVLVTDPAPPISLEFIVQQKHCISDYNDTTLYEVLPTHNKGGIREIAPQIAFIILKHPQLQRYCPTFLSNLHNLKEKRNKLYLTHGDSTNSEFYNTLVRETSRITDDDCKNLFRLVYFILTTERV